MVDELGLSDSDDTLCRWMAHYIAEKIKEAETASPEERQEKLAECCSEILKLWSQHTDLPAAKRPFRNFDPVFRVLMSLDPASTSSRYFDVLKDEELCESEDTRQWLDRASSVDKAARLLIRFCLANAAETALNKESEWVKHASKTPTVSAENIQVITELAEYVKNFAPKSLEAVKQESIEQLISDLEDLNKLTLDFRDQLKSRLEETTE